MSATSRRWRWGELRPALAFLAPNALGFLLFTAAPVLVSLGLSFTHWDMLSPPRWAGLDNFSELLGFTRTSAGWHANDPFFWRYLGNTLFLLLGVPVNLAGSLGLALLLNRPIRGRAFFRLVFYLPGILSGVAVFFLWRFMLDVDYGLLNSTLRAVGLPAPGWLVDPAWAKPALLLMSFWIYAGGTGMVLYLAALQNVPEELLDAARIDGAGHWAQFRHVTWPELKPVTFFLVTMGLINGLQAGFDAAFVMTGGGPAGATTTISFYLYQCAYQNFEMGYASALAWILFVIVLAITLFHWRHGKEGGAV